MANKNLLSALLRSNLFKPEIYDFSAQSPLLQVKNELNHYLIGNGQQTDRLSLRYGVKARSPLVSKNLRHFLDDYHFEIIEELAGPKKLFIEEVFQILCRKKYLVIESKGSEHQ